MKRIIFFLLLIGGYYIAHAQNVGIGTTTPTYPLTIISDGSNKGVAQKSGNTEIGFYTSIVSAYLQTWSATDLNFATNNGSSKFTIANSSGYVGVNTTSPTAQLDVNGTLRIRGNGAAAGNVLTSDGFGYATWQAPAVPIHNEVYSLSSSDFSAESSVYNTIKGLGGGGIYYSSAVSYGVTAPIHLPNGAKVTKITFAYYDNTAQDFTFSFGYEGFFSGFSFPISAYSSGAVAGYRSEVINLYSPYIIDNTKGGYFISANTSWPGNSDMAIKGVMIEYNY
ncbi:MAG: hypothetical protein ABJA78_01465 [Ferruginibacter sp.]